MQGLDGATEADRLGQLVKDMKAWHVAQKATLSLHGKLTVARIRASGDWPRLKAKAATVRHLVPYTHDLAKRHDSGSEHDRLRIACCQVLETLYDTLEKEGRWLSTEAKQVLTLMEESELEQEESERMMGSGVTGESGYHVM